MTTDGEFLVVTELADHTQVNPLKYGSSEIDPDPVNALVKHRNEIYAVNRYTIEVFTNVGGNLFPFQRINGAEIQKGSLGTHCSIAYEGAVAFLGSGRKESPAVYLGANGQTQKISTREIDEILEQFTEKELALSVMETMNDKSHELLWLRIPDRTLVYDLTASRATGELVWYIMTSATVGFKPYRARDVVWCYDKWQVGDTDTEKIGVLDDTDSYHFGLTARWEFGTKVIYNEGKGAIFHELELVSLAGRLSTENPAIVSTSYSVDGQLWSQPRGVEIGQRGDRLKRIVWRRQGRMKQMRIQRFTGDSNVYLAVSRLEAQLEPLRV
jgi:hypothetical protein